MREIPFTKNLVVTSLLISIFATLIMGFVIGSLVENLKFNDLNYQVSNLLEDEFKNIYVADNQEFDYSEVYNDLKAREPAVIGLNIIDGEGKIIYSDEPSLKGKFFSDNQIFAKTSEGKSSYFIDRNLVSQETILKDRFTQVLLIYHKHNFYDNSIAMQVIYDITSTEKSINGITLSIWITVFLSVGLLLTALMIISASTNKALEEIKNSLEIEVRKRTTELEKSKFFLDKQIKERTKALEETNRDLVRKTIELTELKGQIEDKNTDLETANKEIISLLKSRTDFMNQAAHDLRTPLTPIITLLPLIKGKVKDAKIKQDISIVENNVEYLRQIVNELVSMIRSDVSKSYYDYEKIDIKDLIGEVIMNGKSVFDLHKVVVTEVIAAKLPKVMGNKLKLIEVLQNLIFNSVKFMPKGGELKITAFKKDNFIYVAVKDTGLGMTKKTISKLFEPFFKADKSRHAEGSGLGLSICKKILEAHKGGIIAQSEGLGKGSTFTFYLPVSNGG